MSEISADKSDAAPSKISPKALAWSGILVVISAVVLIWTELGAAVAATVWAVSGYFHLPLSIEVMLAVVLGIPAIGVAIYAARAAWQAERENDE